jgi:phage FluMu protein Com
MTGFCGTGKMLQIYRYQTHSKCPRCKEDDQTTLHVIRCKQTDATKIWTKSIQNLEHWMITNLGHPELVELDILGLTIWHSNERIPFTYDILKPTLQRTWTKQRRFGWTSFIEGFWAIEW